jgi:hypothetical protein
LEKTVEVVLEELAKNPPPRMRRPAFPNYHTTTCQNAFGSLIATASGIVNHFHGFAADNSNRNTAHLTSGFSLTQTPA